MRPHGDARNVRRGGLRQTSGGGAQRRVRTLALWPAALRWDELRGGPKGEGIEFRCSHELGTWSLGGSKAVNIRGCQTMTVGGMGGDQQKQASASRRQLDAQIRPTNRKKLQASRFSRFRLLPCSLTSSAWVWPKLLPSPRRDLLSASLSKISKRTNERPDRARRSVADMGS